MPEKQQVDRWTRWFTEGFDAPDLEAARALLDALP